MIMFLLIQFVRVGWGYSEFLDDVRLLRPSPQNAYDLLPVGMVFPIDRDRPSCSMFSVGRGPPTFLFITSPLAPLYGLPSLAERSVGAFLLLVIAKLGNRGGNRASCAMIY
jgi:hypothetical protein